MTPSDVYALGLIITIFILYTTSTRLARWLSRRRWQGAKRSELKAGQLLKGYGFHVVRRRPSARLLTKVNGRPHYLTVQADFLARKGFHTYVVELISGQFPPTLGSNARQKLLFYQLAFHPWGVILLDTEKGKHKEVTFGHACAGRTCALLGLAGTVGFILGGAVVYIWGKGMRL
ncbi:MAG TPA: hypothetical protein GXX50_00790 [Firmicutes bacterium]|nr:hypothetical protein [Bacillota bacterium]